VCAAGARESISVGCASRMCGCVAGNRAVRGYAPPQGSAPIRDPVIRIHWSPKNRTEPSRSHRVQCRSRRWHGGTAVRGGIDTSAIVCFSTETWPWRHLRAASKPRLRCRNKPSMVRRDTHAVPFPTRWCAVRKGQCRPVTIPRDRRAESLP